MRYALLPVLALVACGGGEENDSGRVTDTTDVALPETYDFTDRFGASSSVSYSGQTFRHLLIADLTDHVGGLTDRLNTGFFPVPGEVEAELDFYLAFDSATAGGLAHGRAYTPGALQVTYDDVASDKDLISKLAGNDGDFPPLVGWSGVTTAEELVRLWTGELDAAAVAWSNGDIPVGPDGQPVPAVYVDAAGRDRQQLLQKLLLGAVTFHQAADDYLDEGLDEPHGPNLDGETWSGLEHAWDEAFGYFGASRTYGLLGDAAIADPGYADTHVADGAIDLTTEVCWGHAVNAAKRDLGAGGALDLSGEAWAGFLAGRHLLATTEGELTADQRAELESYRDQAIGAWEAAIAATAVHYVNDTLAAMDTFGGPDYDLGEHAKVWSELKGFALALQFNPRSPMSAADLANLHDLLGDAPVLPDAGEAAISAYREDLLAARSLLAATYGFEDVDAW